MHKRLQIAFLRDTWWAWRRWAVLESRAHEHPIDSLALQFKLRAFWIPGKYSTTELSLPCCFEISGFFFSLKNKRTNKTFNHAFEIYAFERSCLLDLVSACFWFSHAFFFVIVLHCCCVVFVLFLRQGLAGPRLLWNPLIFLSPFS